MNYASFNPKNRANRWLVFGKQLPQGGLGEAVRFQFRPDLLDEPQRLETNSLVKRCGVCTDHGLKGCGMLNV
jgi:hypothetical protein